MIRIAIVEDEPYARKELKRLLTAIPLDIELVGEAESVAMAVELLKANPRLDLLFLDIQLSDGLSFEIFNQLDLSIPIIFTTAFDQFTLQAFRHLSIDYLLKPIEPDLLLKAFEKYHTLRSANATPKIDYGELARHLAPSPLNEYKRRFIGRLGNKLVKIDSADLAYSFSDSDCIVLRSFSGKELILDQSLDQLEKQLDPSQFFRINRQMLVQITSIQKTEKYNASQWMLILSPAFSERVLVSRARTSDFLNWMDS